MLLGVGERTLHVAMSLEIHRLSTSEIALRVEKWAAELLASSVPDGLQTSSGTFPVGKHPEEPPWLESDLQGQNPQGRLGKADGGWRQVSRSYRRRVGDRVSARGVSVWSIALTDSAAAWTVPVCSVPARTLRPLGRQRCLAPRGVAGRPLGGHAPPRRSAADYITVVGGEVDCEPGFSAETDSLKNEANALLPSVLSEKNPPEGGNEDRSPSSGFWLTPPFRRLPFDLPPERRECMETYE